ncbi:hypothetical protein PR048_018853 [Dryococelus australis]|uniref:Uncharacterized protein n=1 Tax=Dryococelus australis TaxID=614101 RepID=A0ABQ9H1X9_9NEOP|nr:hypothetical protein PR048_018853 [Dryococelus australis]
MFTYKAIRRIFFFCRLLPTNSSESEILNTLVEFFSSNEIPWENSAYQCSDGAKTMAGHNAGATSKIKSKANKYSICDWVLHRHALPSRKLPSELMVVLNDAIQIINYIKSRPLKSRLFKVICEDMGSHHQPLKRHTEVRWLSRGKRLIRLMELSADVAAFLMVHNALLATVSNDEDWVCKIDVFD